MFTFSLNILDLVSFAELTMTLFLSLRNTGAEKQGEKDIRWEVVLY